MQYVREKKKKKQKRHRNIGQMKKQGRNAQDQINKEEMSCFTVYVFFPDGEGCVRQYNLECLWESCG